jgi:hypothetical protein
LVVRLCLRKEATNVGRGRLSEDGKNMSITEEILRTAALGLRTRPAALRNR